MIQSELFHLDRLIYKQVFLFSNFIFQVCVCTALRDSALSEEGLVKPLFHFHKISLLCLLSQGETFSTETASLNSMIALFLLVND